MSLFTLFVPSAQRGQRRVLDRLELELQVAMTGFYFPIAVRFIELFVYFCWRRFIQPRGGPVLGTGVNLLYDSVMCT